MQPPLYTTPLAEIVVEEEAVGSVGPNYLEARGESKGEVEIIDVVGGGDAGMRCGTESESFIFVNSLRRANLIAAFDPETVSDVLS